MFNKKIVVTDHAIERYNERSRSKGYRGRTTYKSIMNDLRPMNVMRIKKLDNGAIKVFTRGKREFILEEKKNCYLLRTIIQKNRDNFEPSTMRKV